MNYSRSKTTMRREWADKARLDYIKTKFNKCRDVAQLGTFPNADSVGASEEKGVAVTCRVASCMAKTEA